MSSSRLPAMLVSFLFLATTTSFANTVSKVEALNEQPDWNVARLTFDLHTKDAKNVVIDVAQRAVYVGALNYLYALELDNVEVVRSQMEWRPDPKRHDLCAAFEPNPELCTNVIHILHSVNDTHLYACGTNARQPRCIYVNKKTFTQEGPDIRGESKSPGDPFSKTVSTMTGGSLFTADNPNSRNKNGIIRKSPADRADGALATDEFDNFRLSDARFVSMFTVPGLDSDQEKIVVLFKENAEEIPLEILTQDSDYSVNLVYSRMATLCANDRGGLTWLSQNRQLATFSKMRIACPVSIQHPGKSRAMSFFYDEIESSYVIPNPEQPDNPTVYAIFRTPKGAYHSTATCVYSMRDIRQHMDTYKYWNKPNTNQDSASPLFSWYSDPDYPAPGSCEGDTSQFSKQRAIYGNEHPLKFGMIKPKDGFAIYQDSGVAYSYIIVDRIRRKEIFSGPSSEVFEKEYDVVHYITDVGLIKRIVFSVENRSLHWEIPQRQLYNESDTKHKILTVKKGDNGFIYFGTSSSVEQIRIAGCEQYATCGECRLANDPYCEWDELDVACKEVDFTVARKDPHRFLGKANDTGCSVSDSRNDHKKQSPDDVVLDRKELMLKNEVLTNQTRALNRTVARLEREKLELQTDLTRNMNELYNQYNNYTQLSTLLLQYDERQKIVVQLYRDTMFSLHKCQQEKLTRKRAERNAIIELKAYKNATSKCDTERKTVESSECKCNKVIEKRGTADPQVIRNSARYGQDPSNYNLLSACNDKVDRLHVQVSYLKQAKANLTRQRHALHLNLASLKKENAKLSATLTESTGCASKDQWKQYLPTNKLFLLTQESKSYAEAERECEVLGGSVALLKDEGEARFAFNLTHSRNQRKRYWVGLRKFGSSVQWSDGSNFDQSETPRFPTGQRGKLRNSIEYCVETLHHVMKWSLTSCSKHRRVICMKDDDSVIR